MEKRSRGLTKVVGAALIFLTLVSTAVVVAKNHRMSQQVFGLNRLSDLPELRERAQEVLKGLEKGKI